MNTKQVVLSRVRTIRLMRPFVSNAALSFYAFGLALYGIGREVWVAKVFGNMPSLADLGGVSTFFLDAFLSTSFVVQALSLVSIIAVAYFAREVAKLIASAPNSARASL